MSDDQDTIIQDEPLKFLSLFRKREIASIQFTHQKYLKLYDALSCTICKDLFDTPVYLKCSHRFCKECIEKYVRLGGKKSCPNCRGDLSTKRDLRTDYGLNTLIQYAFGNRKKFCQQVQELQDVQASTIVFKRTDSGIQSRVRPKPSNQEGKSTRKKVKPNESSSKIAQIEDIKKLRKKKQSTFEIIISQDNPPNIQEKSQLNQHQSRAEQDQQKQKQKQQFFPKTKTINNIQTKQKQSDNDNEDNQKQFNFSSQKKNEQLSIDVDQADKPYKPYQKQIKGESQSLLQALKRPNKVVIPVYKQLKKRGRKKKSKIIQIKSSSEQVQIHIQEKRAVSVAGQENNSFEDSKILQEQPRPSAQVQSNLISNRINNQRNLKQKKIQKNQKQDKQQKKLSKINKYAYSQLQQQQQNSPSQIDLEKYKVSQKNSQSKQNPEAIEQLVSNIQIQQNKTVPNEFQQVRKTLQDQFGQKYMEKLLQIPHLQLTIPIKLQKYPNHPFTPSIKCKSIKLSVQSQLQTLGHVISKFLNIQKDKIRIYVKSQSNPLSQSQSLSYSAYEQISTKENLSKKLYEINQKYWKIVRNIEVFDMKNMLQTLSNNRNNTFNNLSRNSTNNLLKQLQLKNNEDMIKPFVPSASQVSSSKKIDIPTTTNRRSSSKTQIKQKSKQKQKSKSRQKPKSKQKLKNQPENDYQHQHQPQSLIDLSGQNNQFNIDQYWRVIYYKVQMGPLPR